MASEDDELPPLPRMPAATSPKRLRRRSPFSKEPAVASATFVPSIPPDQVISTLIDSLTAISQDARDQLKRQFDDHALFSPSLSEIDRPTSSDSFYVDVPVDRRSLDPVYEDDDSEGEYAAAPVIRFSRAPSPRSKKKPKKNKPGTTMPYLAPMHSDPSLSIRSSFHSLHSEAGQGSMGVPSIERPNGSATSLTGSVLSARSLSRLELDPPEQNLRHLIPSRRSSTHTSRQDRARARYSFEVGDEKESALLKSDFDGGNHSTPLAHQSEFDETHESQASPLSNRLNRGDLGEHLIPSRRSSRRKSEQLDLNELKQHSTTSSQDLKNLNIDDDLIGSDDSTVRRIRELQEAKEKRQSEWRKEARKSLERPSKRHSGSERKSNHRNSTYQNSKLSVTEVLVESEQETSPDLSARIDASDLAIMPALVVPTTEDEPLTPVSSSPTATRPPLRASQSTPTPPTKALSSQAQKHSPRGSDSLKRSSTVSSRKRDSILQNDVKSIQEEVETFLAASRLTQKIRHPRTGRTIAFSEVGDPNGFVVICCVGMGMTRFVMTFYDELAKTLKLRLITPDRPGVGESEGIAERLQNPLTWVDDVAVICSCLEITRFSLLAHSAGSIYALATALKMPQYVRGRIHLLAPWIPPSQMPKGAAIGPDSQPVANLPMAHRILSVLPAPILKVANSRFLSATSASVEAKPLKGKKLRSLDSLDYLEKQFASSYSDLSDPSLNGMLANAQAHSTTNSTSSHPSRSVSCYQATNDSLGLPSPPASSKATPTGPSQETSPAQRLPWEARATLYNSVLTHRIWTLATLNANPAIDLLVCLERRKTIGFRYAEVTRSVVIRHGAKDGRVPLDNVRWLQGIMKRCELRVLEDEGHSLMASASVMSNTLTEIAKEWDEWERIAKGKEKKPRPEAGVVRENRAMSLRSLGTISVRS